MPKTKKESFIFTLMMCCVMVLVMTFYNQWRIHGLTQEMLHMSLIGFPLAFIVAFIADWILVGPLAKRIAFTFIGPKDPVLKKILWVSTCMVTGMVIIMSLFGALMGVGLSTQLLSAWAINIPYNFIVALPLQVLIAGPLVRTAFGKMVKA